MPMNNISTISKNYAKALFESGLAPDCVKYELSEIINTIDSSKDLEIVLSNSSISCTKKIEIIEGVFKGRISIYLLNLLKILAEKNRLSELGSIYAAYNEFDNQKSNKKSVQIVSSIQLNDEIKKNIVQKLEQKLTCEVLPQWQVDKSIIAGLVFKYDDCVIDTSVLSKLKQLSK